jgi:hypothetical protein
VDEVRVKPVRHAIKIMTVRPDENMSARSWAGQRLPRSVNSGAAP